IIDFEDIDQDGDIDIYRHSNAWYNDGLGNFSEKAVLFSNRWLEKSEAIDLDQDSDIDFIGYESDVVIWYEKKDGEDYKEQHIFDIPERYEYKSSQTGDIDQDGDIDLLVSISRQGFPNGHNVIYFLENDGNNNFIGKAIYEEEVTAWIDVYLDDLDQDGDLDMLTTSISGGGNNLFFHENLINTPIIQGVSFFDRNDNGIFDSTEMTIDNLPIILTPNVLSSYTDANGTYRFYVPNGTYTLTVQPDSCYQLTTDSLSYMVTIDGDVALNKNFGFQLASDYQHTQTRINSAATRCGFDVPFTISVQNDGCVPSKGQYGLVLDSLVTLIETAIEPNEIRGDTLLWNYEELFSTQSESIKLTLQIAGTEFLGDFIQLTGLSYIENEAGELKLSSTYDYTSEIRCAYDPNDKLVYPNRLGDYDKNYILFEEELEYTVRFQNTGTDTAFTVVIKDYLDPNLNWKTFKPVVSSHPHETLLHPDGLVEFTFKNILLPDSTTNEPLSHGFVTYKIQPNADLDENTNIENTANIFFDFNPPIQTNTTSNVLVEELPKTTSTRRVTKADFPIKIYPNPFEEVLTFELEQFQPAVLEIFDARGRLVRTASLQSRVHQESVSNLASGFYFYRLLTSGNYQLLTSGKVVKR
ncbi:MAG: FG-GAP-like repeat-containing protein, partial [Bacteroidota bacterium]